MNIAYLTIDDGPTKNTKAIMDFLKGKNITPILFFWGERIGEARAEGIYAIQNGAIIGNHSFTHPFFSKIELDECISEIERQEDQIEALYKEAGVPRKHKLFRFPYGDKGGKNKSFIQDYFAKNGFSRIDDSRIQYDWYRDSGLDKEHDVYWTFDFTEYQLTYNNSFTREDIFKRIHNEKLENCGSLLADDVLNIVLIHDHENTDEIYPNYFYEIINHVIDLGVNFVKPEFIKL